MNILVVDDDPEIVSFLKRGLIYEGYSIDTASDGAEALKKAREREPDLVILDDCARQAIYPSSCSLQKVPRRTRSLDWIVARTIIWSSPFHSMNC